MAQQEKQLRPWSDDQIRDLCIQKLGKRPCWYQLRIAEQLRLGRDVVGCARTGAGKTMSFWMPLLMSLADGCNCMIFVVTALNLLGKQNAAELAQIGIRAIALSAETAKPEVFNAIEVGKYQVVIISPEIVISHPGMQKIWNDTGIVSRIQYIVFDEGHCISQWASFRDEYSKLGALRSHLSYNTPFYVASATLPPQVLTDVRRSLGLRNDTKYIIRSNDRPEIALTVRAMQSAASSYQDLDFIFPKNWSPGEDSRVAPFVIFFDNTKECEAAVKHLRLRLPQPLRDKIKWFHSTLTPRERDDVLVLLKEGKIWGICCTDAFGLGMDLSGIEIVVQWRPPSDLCMLWQRFGRAARGPNQKAVAILIVPKECLLAERQRKAVLAEKRAAAKTIKAAGKTGMKRKKGTGTGRARKRQALEAASTNTATSANTAVPATTQNGSDSDDEAIPVPPPPVLDREERRQHYANDISPRQGPPKRAPSKKTGVVVGSAIDDYINPAAYGFTCRREVAHLYFCNDEHVDKDHLHCDPTSTSGCSRCAPRSSFLCCDLCSPNSFSGYSIPYIKPPTKPGKSKVRAMDPEIAASEKIQNLRKDILEWRRISCLTLLGANAARSLGGRAFMTDKVVERLIKCIEGDKIKTPDDIPRETGWFSTRAKEFGMSLIDIMRKYYPIPPSTSPSDPDVSSTASNPAAPTPVASTSKPPTTKKCGQCGSVGHIASNSMCPMFRARNARKENMPP